jgi:DNA-directed RNA polymerase specialized sigma24 family protein
VIRTHDVGRYLLGPAGKVLCEAWGREDRGSQVSDADAAAPGTARQEEIADCLGRCLDALPPESKALLVRYYAAGDPSGKAAARWAIADGIGVDVTALRLRLHRLRANLEACTRQCLEEHGQMPSPAAASSGERERAHR